MKDTNFRFGRKRFVDDVRYPRGFRRCGDFTIAESELLADYGDTMAHLASAELVPESAQEHRFVAVCRGEREPVSPLERVWLKYQRLARRRPRRYTLFDSVAPGYDNGADSDPFFDD